MSMLIPNAIRVGLYPVVNQLLLPNLYSLYISTTHLHYERLTPLLVCRNGVGYISILIQFDEPLGYQ